MQIQNLPETGTHVLDNSVLSDCRSFLQQHSEKTREFTELIGEIDNYLSSSDVPWVLITYDFTESNFFEVNKSIFHHPPIIDLLCNHQGKLIFVSTEGNHRCASYPQILNQTHKHYQLEPGQIHFITGSHYPDVPNTDRISMHFVPLLWMDVLDSNSTHTDACFDRNNTLESGYKQGTYFSALSKNNRTWRSWAVYQLLHSRIRDRGQISYCSSYGNWHIPDPEIAQYMEGLELAVQDDMFNIRDNMHPSHPSESYIFQISPACYDHVLFHINMETHQHDHGCVFYTEKTIKALCAETPIITWGEVGMNTRHFEDLGFATYSDWFDLSFDSETDPERRWQALQLEVERVCDELDGMSRSQQIAWSIQNQDILKHNKQQIIRVCEKQILKFCQELFR